MGTNLVGKATILCDVGRFCRPLSAPDCDNYFDLVAGFELGFFVPRFGHYFAIPFYGHTLSCQIKCLKQIGDGIAWSYRHWLAVRSNFDQSGGSLARYIGLSHCIQFVQPGVIPWFVGLTHLPLSRFDNQSRAYRRASYRHRWQL